MASSYWKLKALMKKNLLEMRRNICSTLCEIFFPIILMLLIYALKTIFDINNYEFDLQEGSIQNYTKTRSVFNLDTLPNKNGIPYNKTTIPDFNGMSILPALNICSKLNDKKKEREKIATVGVPDEIKKRLINESWYFQTILKFNLTLESFKDFENEEEMNNYIKSTYYGENEENPLICFGISFSQDKNNHKYDYSLHYFENSDFDGAADVPKSSYLIDPFQSGPNLNAYSKYQTNGYSYIMKIITDYIYSQEINNDTKINFGIVPMKYDSYRSDPFGSVIGFIGPFFIIIAYMGNLCIYVYRMVYEKETRVKEGMKIMGLTDGIYFLSYFIQYALIALFDAFINAGIFLMLFTRIPYVVFFFIFFLFSLIVFALAFFFSLLSKKLKSLLY